MNPRTEYAPLKRIRLSKSRTSACNVIEWCIYSKSFVAAVIFCTPTAHSVRSVLDESAAGDIIRHESSHLERLRGRFCLIDASQADLRARGHATCNLLGTNVRLGFRFEAKAFECLVRERQSSLDWIHGGTKTREIGQALRVFSLRKHAGASTTLNH